VRLVDGEGYLISSAFNCGRELSFKPLPPSTNLNPSHQPFLLLYAEFVGEGSLWDVLILCLLLWLSNRSVDKPKFFPNCLRIACLETPNTRPISAQLSPHSRSFTARLNFSGVNGLVVISNSVYTLLSRCQALGRLSVSLDN